VWSTSHALPDFAWIEKNEDSIDVRLWSGGLWLCFVRWMLEEARSLQLQGRGLQKAKGPVDH
jgi:hypothetical protein